MLRLPEWIWGLAIPIGCGFMAVYSVIVFVRTIKTREEFLAQKAEEISRRKESAK